MTTYFADSSYWIAMFHPKDSLHEKAVVFTSEIPDCLLVTTDAVFIEVLNQFSSRGSYWKKTIVKKIKNLYQSESVKVLPINREVIESGLQYYESRLDKEYSFVDCISMVIMKEQNITDVLTNDHHFVQEGFTILL